MPGLVKIGRTADADANRRISQLYNATGVPLPFTIEFAARVPNSVEVEKALHSAFDPHRVNPRREFFRIALEQAIAILELLHVEDATKEISQQPSDLDQQSVAAAERFKSRRPNLNFEEMGIPIDVTLQSKHDATVATVTTPKKVSVDGVEMSLSDATKQMLGVSYGVAPTPHWFYEDRLLSEIYDDTYLNVD